MAILAYLLRELFDARNVKDLTVELHKRWFSAWLRRQNVGTYRNCYHCNPSILVIFHQRLNLNTPVLNIAAYKSSFETFQIQAVKQKLFIVKIILSSDSILNDTMTSLGKVQSSQIFPGVPRVVNDRTKKLSYIMTL